MTEARKFTGVWIPADVWLDRTLSLHEKVMMVEIDSLSATERGCYASNSYFAEFFGLSVSRVSEIINGLLKKGLISVEMVRDGKRIVERRIRIAEVFGKQDTYSENRKVVFGKHEEPYSGNTKEITDIDNIGDNKDTLCDQDTEQAFDTFWNAGMVKVNKAKSFDKFRRIVRDKKLNPKAFADQLQEDVRRRLKSGQFGFDKLHPLTYLNGERWNDAVANAKKPSRHTGFAERTYTGTPDDEIPWANT